MNLPEYVLRVQNISATHADLVYYQNSNRGSRWYLRRTYTIATMYRSFVEAVVVAQSQGMYISPAVREFALNTFLVSISEAQ